MSLQVVAETGEIVRSLDDWASVVRTDLTGAVEGLMAAGRHLLAAKEQHPGTFVAWIETGAVGIGRSRAYQLMTVAGSLCDFQHVGNLPGDSLALYELARLDRGALESAIASGEITPDMGRKDAKQLVARYRMVPDANLPDLRIVPPEAEAPGWLDATPDTFTTVSIDPPWRYDNRATRGAAEDHYGTMSIEELELLAIPASVDSHLYLWVTNGFLRQGFDLLDIWGFTYRTCLTWVKPQIGLGNYFRSATEHVLFATKGSLPTSGEAERNWFEAPRTQHSAKPECFYDLVERVSPGPYLEMFARRRRMGWHVWGNEA